MHPWIRHLFASLAAVLILWPALTSGQVINLANDVQVLPSLSSTTVNMTGRSELRVTNAATPLTACQINLNSPDSWLVLSKVKPSAVVSTYLGQVRVNGAAAVLNTNVRVVQYEMGAVVIPHSPSYRPLEVFTGYHFTGTSSQPPIYTTQNSANLGAMNDTISSFRLKRGYMATFAQDSNGRGISKVYVAQDGDIEVSSLPQGLDDAVSFIRIIPWRWVSKKGVCDTSPATLNAAWNYNWNNDQNSSLDHEYIPIRQQRWWPGYPNDKQGSTHLLGFNEPDNPVEDAYESLNNGLVDSAIAVWPELMECGLRVGSPAITDGGEAWLYDFIDKADAAGLRVDFVAVHFYRCGYSASQLYDWLYNIHVRTGRPIWVTEMNNGANWTGCADPSYEQNAATIASWMEMMDNAPFIERYAVYSNVEATRNLVYNDGYPTPAGFVYKDNESPAGYRQSLPPGGTRTDAFYPFDGGMLDASGQGNIAVPAGTPALVAGKNGQALNFDGTHDSLMLPPAVADSVDFTFAAWVKWDGGANWQRIFDFGGIADRYFFLSPRTNTNPTRMRVAIKNGAAGGEQVIDTAPLAQGVWTHVAITLKGDTGKLFVNGAVVASNNAMTFNPASLGTFLNYLGKSQFAADPLFDGALDDVRIAGHAFTDSEILALAGTARPPVFSSVSALSGAVQGVVYQGSVSGTATDPDAGDVLTYSKAAGPEWLGVSNNGTLYGTPGPGDVGSQSFSIRAGDLRRESALAPIAINVAAAPPSIEAAYAFEGNANASLGTAHGVASGSPAYVAGQTGQAINLDGADDYVTLPAGLAGSDAITIATWVNWDGGAQWQRIFDFGAGTGSYLFLTPRSASNTVRFTLKNGGAEEFVQTSGVLATGSWVHLVVTLGGGTGRIYLNGALAGSAPVSIKPSDIVRSQNYLGKSQWPDPLFDGRIDNFMIFNHALTGTGVAAIYNRSAPVFTSNPILKPGLVPAQAATGSLAGNATDADAGDTLTFRKISGPAWLGISATGELSGAPGFANAGRNRFTVRVTDQPGLASESVLEINVTAGGGLVGQYAFDGNSNSSVNNVNGTATGSPAFVPGKSGDAIDLDGTDDHVTLPSSVAAQTDITISTWVRWDGGNAWQRIFDFGNTTEWMILTPRSGNDTMRFAITGSGGSGEQILETAILPTGKWVHLAVTLLGSTGRLYVDGAEATSGTITLDPTVLSPAQNYIGKSQWGSDPMFNGQVDEFRIYNRALTAFEISSLAHTDADADGDGYPDTTEGTADLDLDGLAGWLDPDSDGDGLNDLFESYVDTDSDGLANIRDKDSDNDSLPDGWEASNGLSQLAAADATGDLDGDGQPNAAEYTAGTAANNGGDVLTKTWSAGSPFTVQLAGKAGRTYTFQVSVSLKSDGWTDLQSTGPLPADQPVTFSDPNPPAGPPFYRVKVTYP